MDSYDPKALMAAVEKVAPEIRAKFAAGEQLDPKMIEDLAALVPGVLAQLAGKQVADEYIIGEDINAIVKKVAEFKRDTGENVVHVTLGFLREQNRNFVSVDWSFEYIGTAIHHENDVVKMRMTGVTPTTA